MRFAIVGAGAIGAYIGARLWASGEEVALVARGAHLTAIQERGVQVRSNEDQLIAHPFATHDPATIGPVDVVILTLKAPSLPEMAPRLPALFGQATSVVTAQNGIPWWYFENSGGPLEGIHLESVDPGGLLAASVEMRRVIGCVIYCSTVIAEPGVIQHVEGNRFSIGEPDGSRSERCQKISQAFQKAGLKCPIRTRIRHDIWVKLLGNLAFNPISALTRANMEQITQDPGTKALAHDIMAEGEAVARALGVELEISIEKRMDGAARVGAHKTSMLQDVEVGRPLELDCIVGVVVELADKLGVPVPYTRAVYACTRLMGKILRTGSPA